MVNVGTGSCSPNAPGLVLWILFSLNRHAPDEKAFVYPKVKLFHTGTPQCCDLIVRIYVIINRPQMFKRVFLSIALFFPFSIKPLITFL